MGKNTSSKEFPTPVESRDRKDKKVNEKKQTNKKDRIKNISLEVLKDILLCSYDTSSVKMYRTSIKANIALLDFMLERLLLKKYISEKNLYKLASELVEINKMVTGWLNNNESKFV